MIWSYMYKVWTASFFGQWYTLCIKSLFRAYQRKVVSYIRQKSSTLSIKSVHFVISYPTFFHDCMNIEYKQTNLIVCYLALSIGFITSGIVRYTKIFKKKYI